MGRGGRFRHRHSMSSGQGQDSVSLWFGFSQKVGAVMENLSALLSSVLQVLPPGPDPSISICQRSANIQLQPDSDPWSRPVLTGLSVSTSRWWAKA